jgi:SAM-dependent methyltransferase
MSMGTCRRDDGRTLNIVQGFAEAARSFRVSANPRRGWSEAQYAAAAGIRLERWRKRMAEFLPFLESFEALRALEVGCGAGVDCLLFGFEPVERVIGVDMELPFFAPGEQGERIRKLTQTVMAMRDPTTGHQEIDRAHPGGFVCADVARLPFPDHSFDFAWSRSVLEHVVHLDSALSELARVVRPDGLIYHLIDPFYWLRGCHKRGIVDIPWAHARLSLDEYHRFVSETEGERQAEVRAGRLRTLNRYTLSRWREVFDAQPLEILSWQETQSPFAAQKLREHPDVIDTLLPSVEPRDLTCHVLKVWLRNRHL